MDVRPRSAIGAMTLELNQSAICESLTNPYNLILNPRKDRTDVSSQPTGNLFHLPSLLPAEELFETICEYPNLRLERIVSSGQTTPPGQWYNQAQDEWVIVLQGEATLTYDNGSNLSMSPGDYVLLPAHTRHRVDFTSQEPPCIWLAVHIFLPRNL